MAAGAPVLPRAAVAGLIVLAAAVLVVVVVTASAFGTVRDLFGTGSRTLHVASIPVKAREGALPSASSTWTTAQATERRSGGSCLSRLWAPPAPTGQYVHVSGRGRILRMGGHAEAWHAGLVGFVSRPGEAKQRVVITMKGRPQGVFVLTPLQPGFLKRDSGTRELHWAHRVSRGRVLRSRGAAVATPSSRGET